MEVADAKPTQLSFWAVRRLRVTQIIEELTAARIEVQTTVDAALNRNELIRGEVYTWLKESRIVQDRLIERRHYSKNAQLADDEAVQALIDKRRAFGQTVSDKAGLPSRDETAERIIESIKDDEINLVGIYGTAGVGKTVLLNSLYQRFKRDSSFDKVIILTISKHPDVRRIQDNLATQLDLHLQEDPEESTLLRAKWLLKKVNGGGDQKVVILIDDLWYKMDLSQLGIPYKGCKIIFTTRTQSVCQFMEAHRIFQVNILSKEDSLRMVLSNIGDVYDLRLGKYVSAQCKGVPLAIVILGRALRGQGSGYISCHGGTSLYMMDVLQSFGPSLSIIIDPVSHAIQVSYGLLPTKTKACFLFCCLFSEDFKIPCSTLLSYVVGENLIPNVHTLEEIRSSLNSIIEKLINLGLLLKLDQDCVMMHDIVRDVAIEIGSGGYDKFIVKAGMGLTEWPPMNLDTCEILSLMHNKLGGRGSLPTQVIAPKLSTLSLRGNYHLKEIPGEFFNEMKGLLTLDLSETCIVSLPQSLSCLVNLRTLCLDRCYYLNNITTIEKLEKLHILTLSQTRMQRLPDEMRKLVSLKLLDLSEAPNLVTIPPGVISSLSQLEELNMKDSFSQWAVKRSARERNVALSEITTLKHLTCLRVCVENLECLSEDMLQHWKSLKNFEILFGSIVSSSS